MSDKSACPVDRSWQIKGMDCGGCAAKVRGAVERLPGVSEVQVSMMTEILRLKLDESQTTAERIEIAIDRLGYGVQAIDAPASAPGERHSCGCSHSDSASYSTANSETPVAATAADSLSQKVSWKVSGMDCGSCAGKIRGALEKLSGVSDIQVSTMSETLNLRLEQGGTTTAQSIESTVSGLGFSLVRNDSQSSVSESSEAESKRQRWIASTQARLIMVTGLLLIAAWITRLAAGEETARWVFGVACLSGLVPVARQAFAALRSGMPFTIEMLMTIAAGGALIIGATAEAALVVFLFAVGEALEGVAANRARAGIHALGRLLPKAARLETADGVRDIDVDKLAIGQIVQVRPGDRIPTDGEITEGFSGVDESPVTGESMPVAKGPGDGVFAASINTEATLRVKVTKPAGENTIARIIRMVEEAESSRAPTERFIDRFSRYYMPAIVGLAALVAVIPPLFFGGLWDTWIYRALALLLIGCPCALVISVPASIASALYAGTRSGLLMKGGSVIEAAATIRQIAFDKTGTLTLGRPQLTDLKPVDISEPELLKLAAAVEMESSHPLAVALVTQATEQGLDIPSIQNARVIAGKGVSAEIENRRIYLGSPQYARDMGILQPETEASIEALEEAGKTVVVLFDDTRLLGILALRDEPRPDAIQAIRNLKALGITPMMLTGDNPRTAAAIAGLLDVDFRAGLMPEDKVKAVQEMASRGPTMMVGDGINDAPALASAHVGIAMGGGTDVAMETADGALLRNYVDDVTAKIRLARATMANIRQNLLIALGLKGLFLITTIFGVTGLWLAVMADTGATVLVTLNALRLLGFRHK
ncbi:heavy metal translocating P-type ATPase [Marinobacterium mangrovicola]|uniref:P-type Zn(2+) transporter n=1 Tax=Marinobacterium mangrovicola TaxID=1476959 RepID=A0A4R1GXF4_9GAMM|nr:heavy metal translocating P-type ATPase [Marinobacterium mangrovicola]TCK09122.1 Cd2+/Zn2+-exporting ATPase [Marinobacterium mangrovicola]